MAQPPIRRPISPFVAGSLLANAPTWPMLMQPPPVGGAVPVMQPPQLPQRQPQRREPMPAAMSPDVATGGLGALGGGGNFLAGLRDLGGDPGLAFAAGVLGGGSTGEALGRGFAGALQARQLVVPSNAAAAFFDKEGHPELAEMARRGAAKEAMEIWKVQNSGNYGLTPIPYRKADGSVGYAVPSRSGDVKPLDAPGVEFLSPYERKFDEARGSEAGKGMGEAEATLQSMRSKLPGLETVVSKLDELAVTATYTVGGQLVDEVIRQTGQTPRDAAIARAQYIAMVDNQILPLLRDTFGAQFTQREGETLRATLGDPNKAPQEKQAILKAFIEQKRRDIEALEKQTGLGGNGGGGWQDIGNGVRIREIP